MAAASMISDTDDADAPASGADSVTPASCCTPADAAPVEAPASGALRVTLGDPLTNPVAAPALAPASGAATVTEAPAAADGEPADAPTSGANSVVEASPTTDAEAALPYVSHRLTRVRRAALYALANLDIDRFVEQFTASIADPSLRVARDAVAWLVRYPHVVAVHRETIRIRGASYGPTAKRRVDAVLRAGEAYRRRWMQA